MSNKAFFVAQLNRHLTPFVRVLEALPEDKLDYRPHPESRSARELVGHLLGEAQVLAELSGSDRITVENFAPFESLTEGVESFRQAYEKAIAELESMAEEKWEGGAREVDFGPGKVVEMPTEQVAWLCLLDMIHHRGQLSVYVRPMGGTITTIFS